MAQATLTSKGQVTIPKEIRDALRLSTGEKIEFILSLASCALAQDASPG